jgi:hypothetical protein
MLASTVQFSNNDQPPTTPPSRASSLGPAPKIQTTYSPYLQTPNSVPGTLPASLTLSTPRRTVLEGEDGQECRIINVPPMSNQHRTYADVLALDHQVKPGGLDAP